eukprot:764740-Prorocentrum_minimum.AAC.2
MSVDVPLVSSCGSVRKSGSEAAGVVGLCKSWLFDPAFAKVFCDFLRLKAVAMADGRNFAVVVASFFTVLVASFSAVRVIQERLPAVCVGC